jgi:hypothetical protein
MAGPRYNRLSIAAKQALAQSRQSEPAVTCPTCETHTDPSHLLVHVASCPGPRDPHPHSQWISWRDAMRLGVPPMALSRWARRGEVRSRGDRQDRKYLMRDVARRMAAKRANRRR